MPLIIDGFEIDVALTEDPTFSAEVTDHSVENGSNFSDNIVNLPAELNIEGIVSDDPSGDLAERRNPTTLPSNDAYSFLKNLRSQRRPFTVVTHRDTFTDMAIVFLSAPSTDEKGLIFRATFKQIVVEENERTTVSVSIPSASKKIKKGHKNSIDGMTIDQYTQARGISQQQFFDEHNLENKKNAEIRRKASQESLKAARNLPRTIPFGL